jgi:hypothetical protein
MQFSNLAVNFPWLVVDVIAHTVKVFLFLKHHVACTDVGELLAILVLLFEMRKSFLRMLSLSHFKRPLSTSLHERIHMVDG